MSEAETKANFVFPIRELESERVKLTLYDPAEHAQEFFKAPPEVFKYLQDGPFATADEFTTNSFEKSIVPDPGSVLFAILDKTGESPRFAGVIGLFNTSVVDQVTEIGITVLPEFQRTHVTTNAIGLLLHYCLELPSNSNSNSKYGPGLGLRRVQWQTHGDNEVSVRAAERMGFKREGLIRWQRVIPEVKEGLSVSQERKALCRNPGRHTWMLAICWDDWELEGAREIVQKQMERV